MKKEYDMAFGLGASRTCARALRAAGCPTASCPLDTAASPDLAASVDAVCNDFAHWMEADDLRLVDVSHEDGYGTRIYLNERTGFGFAHDFSDFHSFAKTFPDVRSAYADRIRRFKEELHNSSRILAVYLEHPKTGRMSDAELAREVQRLRNKCGGATVDLMYFYEDAPCVSPRIESEADGVMVAASPCDERAVAAFLREHVSVVGRSPGCGTPGPAQGCGDGDKGVFRRCLNWLAYRLYRRLEGILRRRGLVHPRREIRFWDERWEREHGRTV